MGRRIAATYLIFLRIVQGSSVNESGTGLYLYISPQMRCRYINGVKYGRPNDYTCNNKSRVTYSEKCTGPSLLTAKDFTQEVNFTLANNLFQPESAWQAFKI